MEGILRVFLNPHQVVVSNVRSGKKIEISASKNGRGDSKYGNQRKMLSTDIQE